MRISELSAKSGVAIPTIKYYLREGMLHQGEQTAATRAEYDETHLRRLRMIRALLEVGRLSVASIKQVIAAVEDESLPTHRVLGTAHYALSPAVDPEQTEEWRSARTLVDDLITQLGWDITEEAPPPATNSPRPSSGCASSACPSTWPRTWRRPAGWCRRWRWT
ncbi:MerR family transcriptional regulator [Nonomuraea salmonea]|uniref:MerR family transcriptional regulator n=1 Tax=Nonomuraea salmonea TaxID=46181 RepID=UPI002FE985C6